MNDILSKIDILWFQMAVAILCWFIIEFTPMITGVRKQMMALALGFAFTTVAMFIFNMKFEAASVMIMPAALCSDYLNSWIKVFVDKKKIPFSS